MELKSLSASAVKVWEKCPARAGASSINRVPEGPSDAADFGSACHDALEHYVRAVHMEHSVSDDLNILLKLYHVAYEGYLGSDKSRYNDGVEMMKRWHARTDFTGRRVLTVEVKKNFQLPTSVGPITFNYIFDRVDHIEGTNELEVVDYKSWLLPRNVDNMQHDPQMRAYALAAAIEYKPVQPNRVWVTLDQLRYEQVGAVFTRDENKECWEYLKKVAEEIIAAHGDTLEERLNPECQYCVRKLACKKLQDHASVFGPLSLDDHVAATKRLAEVQGMMKGLEGIEQDLNDFLIRYSHEHGDIESWNADGVTAQITFSRRRKINDLEALEQIIGVELFAKYGTMNLGKFDELMKSNELTADQKRALNRLIGNTYGDPKVKASYGGGLKKK